MNRPLTHEVSSALVPRLRALFAARRHALATNPKNEYIAFEVRTPDRSIFTLYTSGKFVCTVRDGDAEGAVLAAEVAALLGGGASPARSAARVAGATPARRAVAEGGTRAAPTPDGETGEVSEDDPDGAAAVVNTPARRGGLSHGTKPGLRFLAGADETGTGELLGTAVLGGALLPVALAAEADDLAGHVDTKQSRAASGWASLGEQLGGLRARGLHLAVLPVPNRLFDAWSKNGLLDLAYVRLVGDLLASAGLAEAKSLDGLELVIDDYGTGPLLADAVEAWRGRGALVAVQTRADDRHVAARIASVIARSHRSREKEGLDRWVTDGPLGTGNAGHRVTLQWLRRRAGARGHVAGDWPWFVKASFKTVRAVDGQAEVVKRRVPPLRELLDDDTARDFLRGRLDVTRAVLRATNVPAGDAGAARAWRSVRAFRVTARGELRDPAPPCLAWEFLPVLCGGLVLDGSVRAPELLERLLEPEHGLLAGWRVLVGPDDAALAPLAAAHRAGILTALPTTIADPRERARRHAAVLLSAVPVPELLHLQLVE